MLNAIVHDQVWDKVLVVPRTDRAANREDHLSAIGDQWPLRQEHDIIGKVSKLLALNMRRIPVTASHHTIRQAKS